ncbi:uncharacterized protein CCOS01_04420 [Colletotrichum costaricense]|uniref:Uncharacterized protein n=1 Tax=Colletotrichum costaricense TaxID=1209916 RepID=A0AAI9Z3Z6_9PEZI|nr:uncharacterized protein CCOS01_04420 [Colletotrichum costaricense]KAK1532437.1 hypothetical protein CCOS01_04420 [Colletotrichum costaricense]
MLLSPFVSWLSLGWLAIEHDFGIFLDSRLSHVGCGIAGPKDVLPAANTPTQILGKLSWWFSVKQEGPSDLLQRHSSFLPGVNLSQLDRVMCKPAGELSFVSLHQMGILAAQVRRSNSSSAVAMSGKLTWRSEGAPRIPVPGLARGGESGHPACAVGSFPRFLFWRV